MEKVHEVDSINVTTYVNTSRYYQYEVYTSLDGENYVKVAEKTDTEAIKNVYSEKEENIVTKSEKYKYRLF